MTLLLSTPEQHDYQDPTLDLDEKRLAERLESLPVLDTGASLRQVLRELQPLNEQRLDSRQRLRLLGLYQPTVRRLFDTAAPLQLRHQLMSQQQREAAVNGVELLCLAMANGFKIVIKELYADPRLEQNRELFGLVLRWAVIQLGAALLHSYRYYRPQPPAVFLELNQLYRLARHRGLHKQPYKDEKSGVRADLATVYQALSLLALSDPFSAEEGQVDQRYAALLGYAAQARIVPGNSWKDLPEGRYFIDLAVDSAPRHCVFLESPVTAQQPFLLDARPALEAMHRAVAGLPAERLRQRPEIAIMRHLLPEVAARDKRAKPRRADGRWIEAVTGLETIHQLLQQRQAGEAVNGVRWQIRDASDSGYRLAFGESAASALQVADLVCLLGSSDSEQPLLQLLVIRWIRDERGSGTELGVELLDGVPKAVELLAEDAAGITRHAALFIPSAGGTQGRAARLVAAPQLYAEHRPLTILVGAREVRVCCTLPVEQAPGFDCFEFTAAG